MNKLNHLVDLKDFIKLGSSLNSWTIVWVHYWVHQWVQGLDTINYENN